MNILSNAMLYEVAAGGVPAPSSLPSAGDSFKKGESEGAKYHKEVAEAYAIARAAIAIASKFLL